MRVLHCIWRMTVGGAERQLVLLAGGLTARGIDVHVATAFPGPNDQRLRDAGATLHCLDTVHRFDPRLPLRMIRLCRRLRPDVVNTWLTPMDIVGGAAALLLRIHWVLNERSTGAAYPPGAFHGLRARIGSRAGAIIANSTGGEDYWERLIRDPRRIHVIPNIVAQFEIDTARPVDDHRLAQSDEVVLYVGRFSQEKGLSVLLEALVPVIRQRPVKAVFLGDGRLRSAVERCAHELGIGDRTLFLGSVSNVFSWMKRANLLVSASAFEGNPNAVLEAVAAGLPIVASDIAGHRSVVGDDGARLFEAGSASALTRALLATLSDRDGAQLRAQRARAHIQLLSADEIAASYEGVYEQVMGKTS